MEKTLDEKSAGFGMNEYFIQRYTQDSETTEADFQWIPGMPPAIPLPAFWYQSETRSLHANSDDTGGEDLPASLIWRIPDVSSEEFLSYANQLSEIGLEGELIGNEQDGWKIAWTVNGSSRIIMRRTNGTVLIAYYPNELTMEANFNSFGAYLGQRGFSVAGTEIQGEQTAYALTDGLTDFVMFYDVTQQTMV